MKKIKILISTFILLFSHQLLADQVEILPPDRSFNERIKIIDSVGTGGEIFLAYFIVQKDGYTDILFSHLMKAALRGVYVKIVVDGMGEFRNRLQDDNAFVRLLLSAGIEIRVYNPLMKTLHRLPQRLHDKLLVTNRFMLVGSSNFWAPSFNGGLYEVDALISESSAIDQARHDFLDLWRNSEVVFPIVDVKNNPSYYLPKKEVMNKAIALLNTRIRPKQIPFFPFIYQKPFTVKSIDYLGASENEPNQTYNIIRDKISSARKFVLIFNPYVLMQEDMLSAFKMAKANGAKVELLTINDKARFSELRYLGEEFNEKVHDLVDAKLDVKELAYSTQTSTSMFHGRIFIIDDEVFFGSLSFDSLSANYNTENGVLITGDDEFMKASHDFFKQLSDRSAWLVLDGKLQRPLNRCGVEMNCSLPSWLKNLVNDYL